jgi:LDH2 family malate/lactate/ureidoglycolate dehydrogenase
MNVSAKIDGPAGKRNRVSVSAMLAFTREVYVACGLPEQDATIVADAMIEADLTGSDAHGIFRLPLYTKWVRAGRINTQPQLKFIKGGPATGVVDGDNGMGHLVMRFATARAIEKARQAGIAWVGVKWSNHAGPASLYAGMPAEHGMIGLYLAVGNANHLPAWGGIDMLLSTNPIAVAVPAGEEPAVVLDMATTVAAYGKVKTKAQRGETMPEGWMMDRQGKPLTDPQRANEGFLLPIGGYKGYGLALIFGLLAGTLNGAAMGRDVVDFNADDTTPTNTGHSIVAIDVEAFQPLAEFRTSVDALIRDLRRSQRLPGVSAIRLPGDGSRAAREERAKNGIPLPPALHDSLNTLARELKIPPLA